MIDEVGRLAGSKLEVSWRLGALYLPRSSSRPGHGIFFFKIIRGCPSPGARLRTGMVRRMYDGDLHMDSSCQDLGSLG